MSLQALSTLAGPSLAAAAERDTGLGNGLCVAEVTDSGVDITTSYDSDI